MLDKKIVDGLNKQLNYEFYSSYAYQQMSLYCSHINLDGAAQWFQSQAQEELAHSQKIVAYLQSQSIYPKYDKIPAVKTDYKNLEDVLHTSLKQEKTVTKMINDLYTLADKHNDIATKNMLLWFIDEQIEEEDTINKLIARFELYTNANIVLFDNELGSRTTQ